MDSQPNLPPIPPHQQLNMDKLIEQLLQRTDRLEIAVSECHQNHQKTLETQNGAIVRALEQNTRVLEKIEKSMHLWERKRKTPGAAKKMI